MALASRPRARRRCGRRAWRRWRCARARRAAAAHRRAARAHGFARAADRRPRRAASRAQPGCAPSASVLGEPLGRGALGVAALPLGLLQPLLQLSFFELALVRRQLRRLSCEREPLSLALRAAARAASCVRSTSSASAAASSSSSSRSAGSRAVAPAPARARRGREASPFGLACARSLYLLGRSRCVRQGLLRFSL